jgi:hypothetical protein
MLGCLGVVQLWTAASAYYLYPLAQTSAENDRLSFQFWAKASSLKGKGHNYLVNNVKKKATKQAST